MPIISQQLPESEIQRDPNGRVIGYLKDIRGRRVWVPVPWVYPDDGPTFLGNFWLQDIPPFLRRQAE